MQVYPNRFTSELQKKLHNLYLVFGDEPQQKFEILTAVREAATANGFDERTVLVADSEFSWSQLIEATQTMSLFSSQQLIELELPTGKPGTEGAKVLTELANNLSSDVLLLIHGPRIGKDVQKTKWFKALDAIGVFSICYPLEGKALYSWIQEQFQTSQLHVTPGCAKLIADFCEGNLLAAKQEIEKLRLVYPDGNIDEEKIEKAVVDQSRFTVFQLMDVMLQGDTQRTVKMLYRLESEGIEPNIVIWALIREWQNLTALIEASQQGQTLPWMKMGIWKNRQGFYQNAMQRLSTEQLNTIQRELSSADQAFKQTSPVRPYVKLCHLTLLFLGLPLGTLPAFEQ